MLATDMGNMREEIEPATLGAPTSAIANTITVAVATVVALKIIVDVEEERDEKAFESQRQRETGTEMNKRRE